MARIYWYIWGLSMIYIIWVSLHILSIGNDVLVRVRVRVRVRV